MSNIDKRALREAAEKALPAMQRLLMMPNDELFDEALLNVDGDVDAANAFNLLTGPETVLVLLDELEAAEKRIADYQELISGLVDISSSILREVDRINNAAAAGKGEAS
ncbi:ead/Ea22-like family protein [Enterobacter hormaechei]|uniref:ead/Ea22-like family protein n=1 Tax=Enterobacter hormaechei TaxID=158836 RepID=UPI000F822FE9|nr:ead/Ea22-like family protein [Enterobacter hormaechei]RTN05237.1 ead/Ea22-like family protein [Enterobacter hormaechei]